WTAIARKYWERAGVDDKIELRIAPAIETLRSLPAEEQFDLAFIDADKPNYPSYYEEVLARLRRNGVILVDNTLWAGAVTGANASVTKEQRRGNGLGCEGQGDRAGAGARTCASGGTSAAGGNVGDLRARSGERRGRDVQAPQGQQGRRRSGPDLVEGHEDRA